MKKRMRFYNRLYFQVCIFFGVLLSVFTILVGVVFIRLYDEKSMNIYAGQLEIKAKNIANKVSEYAMESDYTSFLNYLDAVESMEENQATDIWILSNNKAEEPLKNRYQNVSIKKRDMTTDMIKVLNRSYNDSILYITSYDEIYAGVTLKIAAPIHDAGGNVIGAVLLNSIMESQRQVIKQGKYLIAMSALVAWLVSAMLAALFAGQLSRPISRMRLTARQMAAGKYNEKTGIKRKDEIGQLASSIDILSNRLLKNEVERDNMEQSRRDFFANVSHELRTPITVLRGYTEALVDGYVTEEEKVQRYYERMLMECKGMERLVGDLLTLSKMQNPDFEVDKEPINLIQIFQDIERSARVISQKKKITIDILSDSNYCFILGDYDRLRQMFMVILDNAIKFSRDESFIQVNIESKEKITVSVTDYGIGISEEDLPNIFEKFYKSKLNMNEKGSGLGLVIAKQIALKHEAEIKVISKEKEGTTFFFSFEKVEISEEME